MIDAAVDTFLTRFAAGPGAEWRWVLVPVSRVIRTQPRYYLRAHVPRGLSLGLYTHCPLSAQCVYETGSHRYCTATGLDEMATVLGLSFAAVVVIQMAADQGIAYDQAVWERLVRIAQPEEVGG